MSQIQRDRPQGFSYLPARVASNRSALGTLSVIREAQKPAPWNVTLNEVIPISTTVVQFHRLTRSQAQITDESDADEFLEDAYGVNLRLSRHATSRREGPLVSHVRASVGPLTIDEVYTAGRLEVRPDPMDKVVVTWPSAGRIASHCDGLDMEATAGDIALLAQPHLPFRADAEELRVTAVLLDPALVAGVATGLPASQAPLPIRFSSLEPIDAMSARTWKKTVSYVEDLLAADVVTSPLVLGHACRLLAAVTLRTFPNGAVSEATPHDRTDHKPVLLRRAMDFIDANVGRDIGLAEIAEAVHVTPRAVQYMFRRHLETTPLQYLRRLRLHYAHQDLISADRQNTTVTEVAARWGFAHTGRFAVLYRHTYGQSPHTTLRG